jgi:hypothetical protein
MHGTTVAAAAAIMRPVCAFSKRMHLAFGETIIAGGFPHASTPISRYDSPCLRPSAVIDVQDVGHVVPAATVRSRRQRQAIAETLPHDAKPTAR